MKYVVKLGGAGLETPSLLAGCTRAIAELVRDGHQVAVVHGGGVQLTRMLKALGKQSEFIDGLRVTDAETRDIALMVFAGKVNKGLVAALGALGQPAVGLSGGDGLTFRARKKRTAPDLEAIWQLNGVPVFCSVALGFDGQYYNINADEMAAACAIACRADALVFLTDVPGVKGATGEVLRWLSIDQIAEMAKTAVISGGMLPKLSACREALLNGVKRVRILPAEAAGSLPDLCSSRVAYGTEVMVAYQARRNPSRRSAAPHPYLRSLSRFVCSGRGRPLDR
jgi:acetylglutamate kinase